VKAQSLLGCFLAKQPQIALQQIPSILRQTYGLNVKDVKALPGDRDANFRVLDIHGGEYFFKVVNAGESTVRSDLQVALLVYLASQSLSFGTPQLIASSRGQFQEIVELTPGESIRVRLQKWIQGVPASNANQSCVFSSNLGVGLANLQMALTSFAPAHEEAEVLPWDMQNVLDLREYIELFDDLDVRNDLYSLLRRFETLHPWFSELGSQFIHGDFNLNNALIESGSSDQLAAVLDFGDAVRAPKIFDIAIAATYQVLPDYSIQNALDFVQGYNTVIPLSELELGMIFDLIGARLATWLILGRWRGNHDPDRAAHFLRNESTALRLVKAHITTDRNEAVNSFKRIYTRDMVMKDTLVNRRRAIFQNALPLMYDKPIQLVKGEGVWVTDDGGRIYLDAYNNVPHVGHGHPKILAALHEQAVRLNTNTRYLDDKLIIYAERLLQLFPNALGACLFACSGSEANDLAIRLGRSYTGANGIIVTRNSYHGSTHLSSSISGAYGPSGDAGFQVAVIDLPAPSATAKVMVDLINDAICKLESNGSRLLGFILDPCLTSDGMPRLPDAWLSSVVSAVRCAGGLLIADEIQSGFGRLGRFTWGFEAHGLIPDIVVLGKAIGNGHPMSAVVTRPEILDAFSEHGPYLNTFGGNPVSCAVGMAVLDVMRDQNLQIQAQLIGDILGAELRSLQCQSDLIADVRGQGLLWGIEVKNANGLASTGVAKLLLNSLRGHGVLVGATGPMRNVIKIRPPLIFAEEHVVLLRRRLQDAFNMFQRR